MHAVINNNGDVFSITISPAPRFSPPHQQQHKSIDFAPKNLSTQRANRRLGHRCCVCAIYVAPDEIKQ
jgi:hypothetical protein